ncbi:MAG: DUF4932 domain-containing protein [Sedimentisphaerales bacterium]|nr:DUF4932 domain-containing protein [Sedimentisphaerales bacterium]
MKQPPSKPPAARIVRNEKRMLLPVSTVLCSLVLSASVFGSAGVSRQMGPAAGDIEVTVDPRVELIGIVFRLAGNPEYTDSSLRPYARAIERHFGDSASHPVVKMAAQLRNTRLMSADGPMSLATHIDRDFHPRKSFEQWPWEGLDFRWEREETEEFLERLRQFGAETKFNEFFEAQAPLYEEGILACKTLLAQYPDICKWLDEFFGIATNDELKLVLGFVNGRCNYGPRFQSGQTSEKYAIVAPLADPGGNPAFMLQQFGITVHEFCHSFSNPVVDKYMKQLRPAGEKLFATHSQAMRKRGYQNWDAVMYETAVRACVGSFVRDALQTMHSDYYFQREVSHGFLWTKDLTDLLKKYEDNRDKYPTFESFFPEIVTFLNDYSIKAEMQEE